MNKDYIDIKQDDDLRNLDVRLVRLETEFKLINKQFEKIEKSLEALAQYLNQHKGSSAARNKMWLSICAVINLIIGLNIHLIVFKLFGINI